MVENVSIFIPKYLKVLRTASGLIQNELAEISGVSRLTIIKMENNKGKCTRSICLAIFAGLVIGSKNKSTVKSMMKLLWKAEFGEELEL